MNSCPKHPDVRLLYPLKGGSGFCSRCNQYVQSAGIAMPALDQSIKAKRQRMNAKAKGARNEHRTIELLESGGYRCTRAAASLGVFDIVAIGETDILLIQTKSNRWPSKTEMERIEEFPAPANCRKLIHVWKDRQNMPLVKEV